MNKIKLLTVASSLAIASSLLAPTVANAVIVSSGSNCEAANLNQALQGIGWSQGGVKNNSTAAFFVVCPLDWDSTNPTPGAAVVSASFPGSGTIDCTARSQNLTDGSYVSGAFTVSSGDNTGNPVSGINAGSLTFTGVNNTVVCALDPGEGVTSSYYN